MPHEEEGLVAMLPTGGECLCEGFLGSDAVARDMMQALSHIRGAGC